MLWQVNALGRVGRSDFFRPQDGNDTAIADAHGVVFQYLAILLHGNDPPRADQLVECSVLHEILPSKICGRL